MNLKSIFTSVYWIVTTTRQYNVVEL